MAIVKLSKAVKTYKNDDGSTTVFLRVTGDELADLQDAIQQAGDEAVVSLRLYKRESKFGSFLSGSLRVGTGKANPRRQRRASPQRAQAPRRVRKTAPAPKIETGEADDIPF